MKALIRKLHLFWIFLFFCLLTIFMTFPIAFYLKDSIVGKMGDNIYFVWLISWYQKVIFVGPHHPFFNPWMNYPSGWYLSTTDTALASALPGVPFSLLWGPIAGYNIAMLITFIFSGFFMYIWVKDLTHSEGAALLAGTIYAFWPDHMAHFRAGHLNLCGMEWFPLYFWGLHTLLISSKKYDWKAILLTGLSLGAIAFSSMYYLYMTLIISIVFILVYLIFLKFRPFKSLYFWINTLLASILSSPFLYFALKPFITLSGSGGLSSRSIKYASIYSASPTDFFLPASDHFLFGHAVSLITDKSLWIEGSFYIGLVSLVFAVLALVFNKKSPHRFLIWSLFISSFLSFILALGIDLHWNNQEIIWKIPQFLQSLFHAKETFIYLPSYWLFNNFPFYNKMRALMRFGTFVGVFLPVLAGIGFSMAVVRFSSRAKFIFAIAMILFVLFEFYPGPFTHDLTQPQPRKVDLWLAEQNDEGAVVQMPIDDSNGPDQVYYTLFYQKPFFGGFFNANTPDQFLYSRNRLSKFPDIDSVNLLKKYGIKYIIVNSTAYDDFPSVQKKMEKFGLILLTVQDVQYVYTFANP